MENSYEHQLFQISDNETFKATFEDKELTKELLELILEIEIDHIEFVQTELVLSPSLEAHGIQMDVYAKRKDRVFNVEMQTYKEDVPLQRARYYQSTMDVDSLKKGSSYRELPNSYVIFICTFDIFGKGLAKYNICDWCKQLNQSIDDIAKTSLGDLRMKREIIFLNAHAATQLPKGKLEGFLSYVSGHTIQDTPEFDFARRVEQRREAIVDNREWRTRRMIWQQELLAREIGGREQGLREGRKEGLKQGITKGRKEGLKQGIAKGRNEGRKQGIAEGQEQGREETLQTLAKKYSFDEQEAREFLLTIANGERGA